MGFYEEELAMLNQFEQGLCGEIGFTERAQAQLQDEQWLTEHFDFNLDDEEIQPVAMNDDQDFVEQMASQIDGLWSAYAADVHQVAFAQKQFEEELERREREQAEMAGHEDTICVDRMMFSN